jgi:hypothetical protein
MVTKFAKRILRATGRPIKGVIHEFSYIEYPIKSRKYPVRISVYVI